VRGVGPELRRLRTPVVGEDDTQANDEEDDRHDHGSLLLPALHRLRLLGVHDFAALPGRDDADLRLVRILGIVVDDDVLEVLARVDLNTPRFYLNTVPLDTAMRVLDRVSAVVRFHIGSRCSRRKFTRSSELTIDPATMRIHEQGRSTMAPSKRPSTTNATRSSSRASRTRPRRFVRFSRR